MHAEPGAPSAPGFGVMGWEPAALVANRVAARESAASGLERSDRIIWIK